MKLLFRHSDVTLLFTFAPPTLIVFCTCQSRVSTLTEFHILSLIDLQSLIEVTSFKCAAHKSKELGNELGIYTQQICLFIVHNNFGISCL